MRLIAFQFGYEVVDEYGKKVGRVHRNGGAERYWTIEDDSVFRKFFTRESAVNTMFHERELNMIIKELST